MERAAWTDERLDDLAESIRTGFSRMDADIRGLRTEVGAMRTHLGSEIGGVRSSLGSEMGEMRSELRSEIREVRSEMRDMRLELGGQIDSMRLLVLRGGAGLIVALVGVIAAILVRGG